jgi:hypothetical protein
MAPVLVILAALAVRQEQTPLRVGCDAGDEIVANLPAGTPVDVRFRLADGSDCFKVSAIINGHAVFGYVPAAALAGLDRFERERSSAASSATLEALHPVEAATSRAVSHTGDPALDQAVRLLESNQPGEALLLLDPATKRHRGDPNVFSLAGLAAYRTDHLRAAVDYWRESLALAPNDALARVRDRVQREAESEGQNERLIGMHVALRYEGEKLPADTARAILAALDEEYGRISVQLGCSASERIVAIIQSRETYLKSTGAAEWSGGEYDGRIHIAWTDGSQVDPRTRRSLTHELVHACLTSIPSGNAPWPAWFQEGLAQRLSGTTLSAEDRHQLRQLAGDRQVPRLEDLRQDWSGLSIENAHMAYRLALAAVDALYDNYSTWGIRNIVNDPQRLPQITADLDKKLGF